MIIYDNHVICCSSSQKKIRTMCVWLKKTEGLVWHLLRRTWMTDDDRETRDDREIQ